MDVSEDSVILIDSINRVKGLSLAIRGHQEVLDHMRLLLDRLKTIVPEHGESQSSDLKLAKDTLKTLSPALLKAEAVLEKLQRKQNSTVVFSSILQSLKGRKTNQKLDRINSELESVVKQIVSSNALTAADGAAVTGRDGNSSSVFAFTNITKGL
jgi:uncharacterized coiled-coil protein SlyX